MPVPNTTAPAQSAREVSDTAGTTAPAPAVIAKPAAPVRTPYAPPRLVRFGPLATLTQRVGSMGLRDKAGGGRNKTR
jgi:hypothetical protein